VSSPEPALLRRGLVAMERCTMRLQRSLASLDTFFPIEAGRLQQLAPEHQDDIDAFLKRFEQLVLTLQDQVFIGLAIREGEDPREMSRRDVGELMERLGAVPSAGQFRDFVAVRNRLAHLYPEDPARQAANLNAADEAAPLLLRASEQVARVVERQKSTKGATGGSAR
jgi:hypothetical protein